MANKFDRKFSEQELVRRAKLEKLILENRDPYIQTKFDNRDNTTSLKNEFDKFSKEELETKITDISIAGRIRLFREAGKKAVFANIQDQYDSIQIYVREDEIGEKEFDYFKNLDLGDIIGVTGIMMKTQHGELTVRVKSFVLLTKALKPLPDKHAGIEDIEEKYRRRYLDLIINPKTKEVFLNRTKIIRIIQKFLDERNCFEVETPILNSLRGGAAAKPFSTHYNSLDSEFYLRIAPELYLKRCIVGGFEGVYEIGRLFRNEGMDSKHNPEFTSMELYIAYKDMEYIMELTEELFREISKKINGGNKIKYGNTEIDFNKKWERIHMVDAIEQKCGVDFWKKMDYKEALEIAKKHKIKVEKHQMTVGHIINLFFEHFVEEEIVQPTFIYGHPKEISPLSKSNAKDPRFTDRFELFIIGREYANGFSELNNPIDQFERFKDQIKEAEFGNDEATDMDIDFIEALEYGLPPTVGIGLGIDRLVMLMTDSPSIKDVLLFPQMKNRG